MRALRLMTTAAVGAALLMTTACESAGDCAGFALSRSSDRGGRPTPVAAAEEFGAQGDPSGLPESG
jgi:hypothetical protein